MRSSFNSFYSSNSPSTPLSYNSSSSSQLGLRRSSATGSALGGSLSFRETSNPYRDSLLREPLASRYSNRSSSLAGRGQPTDVLGISSTSSGSNSSRVTRDEETVGLLGRYGNGVRKTSVGDTPTSQFLKQRRQQQQQYESDTGFGVSSSTSVTNQRRQSLENSGLGLGVSSSYSRDQPSTSYNSYNVRDKKEAPAGRSSESTDPTSNEYIQRLMAAHNRVDELLRSRGLNGEDERKYLRAWEEIPIIQVERYRRVRTPSSSSDSGLSTDNDSDRSNSEPTASASTPEVEETEEFSFVQDEEDIQVVHKILPKIKEKVSFSYKISNNNVNLKFSPKSEIVDKTCSLPRRRTKSTTTKQCHLSLAKSKDLNAIKSHKNEQLSTNAVFPFLQHKQISLTLPAAPTPKVLKDARKELKKVEVLEKKKTSSAAAAAVNSNCSKTLKGVGHQNSVEKCLPAVKTSIQLRATFSVKENVKPNKTAIPKRRKTYDDHVKVQQKSVLASLKRKKEDATPSSAEISVQHCSFYTQAKENIAERNVRLNLRMTERAQKNCMAVIVLPSPPRVIYVRKDVNIIMKPKPRRNKTQELPKTSTIGKLNRSFTVELEKEEKELRKVNRLKIPEYFLQSSAEAMEDISGVKNGLRRVPIIGGFLIAPKTQTSPQPQLALRRAGAIRRKPVSAVKEGSEGSVPYSDFCPPLSPIPQIRIQRAVEPDPPPNIRSRRPPSTLSNHLNFHGSLAISAKLSGAPNYESQQHQQQKHFAELSETDKILIERFSSKIHIPRPRAIIRALSPFNAIRALKSQIRDRYSSPPPAHFVRRKNPKRRSPTPAREHKPIKLNHPAVVRKTQPRRHWLDFHVDLKKVDIEKHRLRKKPRRRLIRWIPKWRRRGTDEEIEEVEEEEEEAEKIDENVNEETEAETEISSRSERTKTKSFTDEDEGMTEGARAMAAAKRRQDEEQQAKLVDYEERRRTEREKEEEELKKLKEKQERRRLEREQEEKELEERRRAAEDRRRQEEEERRARAEEEKRKKEEEKNKRSQLIGGGFSSGGAGGRNFTIPKKESNNDKFGNIVQAKQEMGMTKEQQEEAKRVFLANVRKGIPAASELLPADLKIKIKELHQRICKLETEKYDLEKRHERQEYDLKELNERQRQVTRNAALKKGIDPAEVGNARYPPKLPIISKFERKDERSFNERKALFCNQLVKNNTSSHSESTKVPDEIQAYLNSPDRCPKYSEKETIYKPKSEYQPKSLKIPSAFLQSG